MKEKLFNSKNLLVMIVLAVVLLMVGTTYAWWSWTSSNNSEVTFAVEGLGITYEGDATVIKDTLYPTASMTNPDNVIHEFSLVATANTDIYSKFSLEIVTLPEELKHNSFRYNLYNGNTEVAKGSFASATVGEELVIASNEKITNTETNYTLYIWIDGANYNNPPSMGDKAFTVRLKIDASQEAPVEPGLSDEAIAFASLVKQSSVGDMVSLRADEQEEYTPTYQYYVMAKEEDRALLMYYTSGGGGGAGLYGVFDENSNDWENSSLRASLNSTEGKFLADRSVLNELIMPTTIYTRSASNLNEYITTTDRVFIMSEADRLGTNQGVAISYTDFPNDYTIAPDDDGNIVPDGVRMTGSGLYFELDFIWLRTPSVNGNVRYASTRNGGSNEDVSPSAEGVILPMVWIDLSSANNQ